MLLPLDGFHVQDQYNKCSCGCNICASLRNLLNRRWFLSPSGGLRRYEQGRQLADASAVTRISPYLRFLAAIQVSAESTCWQQHNASKESQFSFSLKLSLCWEVISYLFASVYICLLLWYTMVHFLSPWVSKKWEYCASPFSKPEVLVCWVPASCIMRWKRLEPKSSRLSTGDVAGLGMTNGGGSEGQVVAVSSKKSSDLFNP